MTRRLLLQTIAAALALPALAGTALARDDDDDDDDHDRARAALAAGEIRPLTEILAGVERRYVGRVIETDLDRDDGRWIYEFKLLPPTGRMFELRVDAANGNVLRTKGPVQERR
ncbi:PepSY domain-containing protein [Roseomonas populi]|uniref:PepSY domain-containing protein n=1 Tax=Roseomonas populi TaxID=3121582 RepID=A0ABT1X2M3_9PROT|nr:PepSY domain-containing protein [Roseomonas pecuniae]MCR0982345.1 PepSY domain-containing protein [Roseomonas pecuniae]